MSSTFGQKDLFPSSRYDTFVRNQYRASLAPDTATTSPATLWLLCKFHALCSRARSTVDETVINFEWRKNISFDRRKKKRQREREKPRFSSPTRLGERPFSLFVKLSKGKEESFVLPVKSIRWRSKVLTHPSTPRLVRANSDLFDPPSFLFLRKDFKKLRFSASLTLLTFNPLSLSHRLPPFLEKPRPKAWRIYFREADRRGGAKVRFTKRS